MNCKDSGTSKSIHTFGSELLRCVGPFIGTLLLCAAIIAPGVLTAESGLCSAYSYEDVDGDGRPEVMILRCAFATEQDLIRIYDRNESLEPDLDWEKNLDFESDVWIFDVGADGTANLVIDFHRDDDRVIADLYDDQTGDGMVAYADQAGRIDILEHEVPTVRVVAENGWWTDARAANYNLTISVDGDLWASFGSSLYRDHLSADAQTDVRIEVYDLDSDGQPDFEVRHLPALNELSPDLWRYAGMAVHLMVNWMDSEPPVVQYVLWPYLGTYSDPLKPYGRSPAPIQIDWTDARIEAIGEFVASRGGENNCFIYSSTPLVKGQVNNADFENPFCFYDLAGDGDGVPEMQIRVEYWPPYSSRFVDGRFPQAMEWIRYSWDQDNNGMWDSGLGLAGRHEITSTITLGDFGIRSIGHDDYPYWVTEKNWDEAVFVDTEHEPYVSSEGIYAAQVPGNVIQGYLTGFSAEHPPVDLEEMTSDGFRLEYAPDLRSRILLYLSPVDRKLHLRGAKKGLLKIADSQSVQYEDFDGDTYLDRWQYLDGDVSRRQLNFVGSHLVYAGDDRVVLKPVDVAPSLFETLPPRNHEEWIVLGQRLEENQRDFEPGAFEAMVAQFPGVATEIEGASVRDFRLTDRGFRFVLELEGGFHIPSDPVNWRALLGEPGAYVAAYDGERLSVRPLTPASLNVSQFHIGERDGSVREQEWVPVQVVLQNDGLEDVHDLLLCTSFDGPQGQTEVVTMTVELVPGQGSQGVVWDWLPPAEGAWEARVKTGGDTGAKDQVPHQVLARLLVDVQRRPAPSIAWLLSLGERPPLGAVVLFVSVTGLAASAAALWTLHMRGEECPERPNS